MAANGLYKCLGTLYNVINDVLIKIMKMIFLLILQLVERIQQVDSIHKSC